MKFELSRRLRELGAVFTPSKGGVGTVYALRGKVGFRYYVRTPWGNYEEQTPAIASSLLFRQAVVRQQLALKPAYIVLALAVITLLVALI